MATKVTVAMLVVITSLFVAATYAFNPLLTNVPNGLPFFEETEAAQSRNFATNPPVISKEDPRYEAFNVVTKRFDKLINLTANPCDDFYQFACGNIPKTMMSSFAEATIRSSRLMAKQLQDEKYRKATKSTALKKLFLEYDKCLKSDFRPSKQYFNKKYTEMQRDVGFDFPFKTGLEVNLTKDQLAKAIGFVTVYSTDTLLSHFVTTNWLAPLSKNGNLLFLDESNLLIPVVIYRIPFLWQSYKSQVLNTFVELLTDITRGLDIQKSKESIKDVAKKLVQVEYEIANIPFKPDSRKDITLFYNVFSKATAEKKFPFLNWEVYLRELSRNLPDLQKEMLQNDFKFIITKPGVIGKLLEYIHNGRLPKTSIANYLYVCYLSTFIEYVPKNRNAELTPYDKLKKAAAQYEKKAERTRTIVKPTLPSADRFNDETSCASYTAYKLPFANARMFIDALFKNNEERELTHKYVSKYVSSILYGFRNQINGLTWMSYETKKAAYEKIDNLVRNIGYPDFVVNDTLLDAYYDTLKYNNTQSYSDREEAHYRFEYERELRRLLIKTGTERDDFAGPPSIVNAWYQPSLNSITFPIGILVEPFYNKDWPASINYGSLGMIAGHELTHGYDNNGIYWDGVGKFGNWMDKSTAASFADMAKCVIDQYSKFCPLKKKYKEDGCINGRLTQGENIADNGGIRASYRAFKNHVGFNGPDPRLDHPVFGRFSDDQLFFLAFAQTWCNHKPRPEDLYHQMKTDVHSPGPYRVLGTIQNFPEFRQAFHCAVGHKYTPEKHCNVWTSDSSSSYGIPTPPPNPTNERTKEEVEPTDTKYEAYKKAASMLEESIDLRKDPCNSFYEYACGKHKKPLSFAYGRLRNYLEQANQMSKPKYKQEGPEALKKAIKFYEKCMDVWSHYYADIASGDIVKAAIGDFAEKTTFTFNMVEHQAGGKKIPNLSRTNLATALGDLSSKGISTLLSLMIDTDWKSPENGYLMYVDQNTLFYPKSYYNPAAWKTIRDNHLENTVQWFLDYAAVMKKNLDEKVLREDVGKLFDLELKLAQEFSTSETERRQFKRSYNVKTIVEAERDIMKFIDLKQYFKAYAGNDAELRRLFENKNYKIAVMEPDMIKKLSDVISKYTNDQKVILVDYLFYRILMDKVDFLPRRNNHQILETRFDIPSLGQPRSKERLPLPVFNSNNKDDEKRYCAYMTVQYLPLANARFFVDYLYPEQKHRENIRTKTKSIINNVVKSFQSMVNRLNWMDDESKKGAYGKITDLQVNVAYPDLIMNNIELDDYFKDLSFTDKDTYFTMLDKMKAFNLNKINSQLFKDKYDRSDFLGPAGTVNAWYMPELNSITFPAGILRQPFFDENWPSSMNYGGIGVVAGHELTHGFDDKGVQWDGRGKLRGWMSKESKEGFKNMAKCVVEEYSKFCPLKNTTYQPQCVNGELTQGENIADNGGIRAAYEGYRDHVSMNGPDPQLPSRLMSRFSHDQLFFISFAQVWCQQPYPPSRLYKQLMIDPHSPSKYRVFGTIQNFPEFRAAFNCPAGSEYGPEPGNFCPVWAPQA